MLPTFSSSFLCLSKLKVNFSVLASLWFVNLIKLKLVKKAYLFDIKRSFLW